MQMAAEELTRYLKMASDLESSIYRQEQVINSAESEIQPPEITMKRVGKPIDISLWLESPDPPDPKAEKYKTEAEKDENYKDKSSASYKAAGIMEMIVAIASIAFGIAFSVITMFAAFIWVSVFGLVVGIMGAYYLSKSRAAGKKEEDDRAAKRAEYEKDLAEYEQELAKAKKSYQKQLVRYEKKVEKAKKDYGLQKEQAEKTYALEKQQLNDLSDQLVETKQLLARLYSNDWIFEKYRNMVAMATMYEYFASGRCTELKGPNGAYNLFEQELRQNLILNKLDLISSQLEDIKQNQYILYTELKRTNNLVESVVSELQDIRRKVQHISDKTDEIAVSSQLIMYYSKISSENTEALKYIELVTR